MHWHCGYGQKIYKSRNEPVTLYDKVTGQVQATQSDHKGHKYFYQQICLTDYQD